MKWNEMIIHSARCLWYCAVIIFRFESLGRFFCRVPLFTFKVKKKHYSTIRILHVIFIILICKKSFFLFLFVCLFVFKSYCFTPLEVPKMLSRWKSKTWHTFAKNIYRKQEIVSQKQYKKCNHLKRKLSGLEIVHTFFGNNFFDPNYGAHPWK